MYAQLGNIRFETLIGYDSLEFKRSTNYTEHSLINAKNNLQPVGEALTECSFTINFHVQFCIPEVEIEKLESARRKSIVLPFIFGNGLNKGNFLITEAVEAINQTDPLGNYISVSYNVTLKEYVNEQLDQDVSSAFAVTSNRPLPINIDLPVSNPALSAMNSNKEAQQISSAITEENQAIANNVDLANSAPPISKAQKFVDSIPSYVIKNNALITKSQVALSGINNLMAQYSGIIQISPTLPIVVSSCQAVLVSLQNQNNTLSGLPTSIPDVITANTVLNELISTTSLVQDVNQNFAELNKANSKIAIALATKKNLN